MLPKAFRLPATTRLTRPKTVATDAFLLRYTQSQVSHFRCSIVVSKKVDKRAIMRNHLRRLMLQVVSEFKGDYTSPVDMLFIIRKPAVAMDGQTLQELVRAVLQKEELV